MADSKLQLTNFTQDKGIRAVRPNLRADFNEVLERVLRMGFDYNLKAQDQKGTLVNGTWVAGFSEVDGGSKGQGTIIGLDDVMKISRGNEIFVGNNMGKSLTLDGTNQSAFRANETALHPEFDDFMVCGWIKLDGDQVASNDIALIGQTKSAATSRWSFDINTNNNLDFFVIDESGNTVETAHNELSLNDGVWHFCVMLIDKGANGYIYINGDYWKTIDASSLTDTITPDANFILSPNTHGAVGYFDGDMDEWRYLKFGVNGLYVTGAIGTDGEIRVGDASGPLIWSDTDDENMIKRLYYSPYSSLTSLGYGSIDDADRTERHDGYGNVTGLVVGKWYMFVQGTGGHDLSGGGILTASGVFEATATTASISSGDGSDSVKEIGEVARYKFDGDLTDESSNGLDLTGVNTPTYSDNTLINPLMYNSINPHTGTISFWITSDWDGDDGEEHYIYRERYDANNTILIRKHSGNTLQFELNNRGSSQTASYTVSDWNIGESHHVVCTWSVHSLDGTDYQHIYIDGAEVANSTDAIGIPQGVESEMDYGQYDGQSQLDGLITGFQIDHVAWKDTIANAEAAGYPVEMSVEWNYNSGDGNKPIPNEYTGFLHGIGSQDHLQHPALWTVQLAANASNTTFELDTDDADNLDAYRLAMGGSVRILIYKPATYDSSTPYYETILVDDTHTAGVFTVTALTNEAQYTTALDAAVCLNLIDDGWCQQFDSVWTESDVQVSKLITANAEKQAIRIIAEAALGYAYNDYVVAAGDELFFSCLYKTISGKNCKVEIYDSSNAATILDTGNLTSTSWKYFNDSITSPVGCTSIQVRLYGVADEDVVYFNNIIFEPQLVIDGGWEGTSDWTESNVTHITNNTQEKSGVNCGQVTAGADLGYVYQAVTVVDGAKYTNIFNGKATAGDSFKFQVVGVTTGTVYYESDTLTDTDYKQRRALYTIDGDTSVQLRGVCIASGDEIYFDDWSMVPLIVLSFSTETPTALEGPHYKTARW